MRIFASVLLSPEPGLYRLRVIMPDNAPSTSRLKKYHSMKDYLLFSILMMVCLPDLFAQTFKFGTSRSLYGETCEIDSRGFIVNGRRVLPVMGEIHYARLPKDEWRREIRKMKAGGVTMVATYCFWIHHEEHEGVWNWEGSRDLRSFISICRDECRYQGVYRLRQRQP